MKYILPITIITSILGSSYGCDDEEVLLRDMRVLPLHQANEKIIVSKIWTIEQYIEKYRNRGYEKIVAHTNKGKKIIRFLDDGTVEVTDLYKTPKEE